MDSVPSVTANEGTTHTAIREPPPPVRLVFQPITSHHATPSDDIDGKSITTTVNNTKTLSTINNNIDNGTVVMLHGWAQNVHVFSNRCKKLVQRLRQQGGYRVVFLQAPHRLPPEKVMLVEESAVPNNVISAKTVSTTSREYAYGWFLYDEDTVDTPRPSPTGDYPGMNESLQLLQCELERLYRLHPSRPIFLLGFSQGAVIVHKVATLACETTEARSETLPSLNDPWSLVKKCVLVSGFPFRERPATSLEKDEISHSDRRKIMIPSLHVVGRRDTRVPPHLTRQMYEQDECFGRSEDFRVWEHDRGHVLPTDQAFCTFVIQFLQGE